MTYSDVAVRDFLTLLYRHCYDRDPDAAGMAFWANKIICGETNALEVIAAFNAGTPTERPIRQIVLEVMEGAVKHPQQIDPPTFPPVAPRFATVFGDLGRIYEGDELVHDQSGSIYEAAEVLPTGRLRLVRTETGAFDPGPQMSLTPEQAMDSFTLRNPEVGTEWTRDGGVRGKVVERVRENGAMVLEDGAARPVRQHASQFGTRWKEAGA